MELIVTSKEALETIITDAIIKAINRNPSAKVQTDAPDYFTEKEAMGYLGRCSKTTFYKLVREGKIEKIQLGERRTAYSRVQLAEYLQSVTTKK